ncbi:30773_t:CDS:1 [Gigaspora margarita]|uniref:Uncharacterized protein n=2 Tax=Gigaspora margarita TaxID=4874 RepID=A0A8H4AT56_GIGMA|nr:hypothetical protein F8M41_012471 [Gigaspora margarita]CAG8739480.1 30773_t:CDS:1 [Gigaspora margarita]
MGKDGKPHPIFNKFHADGRKTICSICKKEYESPLSISTAKNHFRSKHLNIWNEIKSDGKGGKCYSRHKVYEYFSVNNSGEHQCNLCTHKYKEPHCIELKYHFSRHHKEIWDSIKSKKKELGDRFVQDRFVQERGDRFVQERGDEFVQERVDEFVQRGDIFIQENCDEVIAERSQTGFMTNDEIPDHDTINVSSDSSNNDDNDVEMVENIKKISLIESIDMENENTEVRVRKDEVIIKGKAKVKFTVD